MRSIEMYCYHLYMSCSYEKMRVTSTPQKCRYIARLSDQAESKKVNKWYDKGSSVLQTMMKCCLQIFFI